MPSAGDCQSNPGRDPQIYVNQDQLASNGGIINNYASQSRNYYYQNQIHDPLKELYNHCSPNAAFNSKVRFDPPNCTAATRCAIIRRLEEWISNNNCDVPSCLPWPSRFFWLYGGAGVGKSSLAQTIAQNFHQNGTLAASFFFFRNDTSRSNGDHLIPSLVLDFVKSFEGMRPLVEEKIRTNPDLFDKTYEVQIKELLIGPLQNLSVDDFDKSKSDAALKCRPRVIVIDGLDECQDPKMQCGLLRVISRAIQHIPYPLRFFVTSRPESHLTDTFDRDPNLQVIRVSSYNLSDDPDADMDIRRYLEAEFEEIRRSHRFRKSLPPDWPRQRIVNSLVERSSRHFIYASTVIKYIQSHKQRPHERLQHILAFSAPVRDRPYAQLDKLYWFIFEGVDPDQHVDIHGVLGILYLNNQGSGLFKEGWSSFSNYRIIGDLLGMNRDDLLVLFDPLLSLIGVDEDLRIFHNSLFDYLVDATRSGAQHLNLAPAHEAAVSYIVTRQLLNKDSIPTQQTFKDLAYHAQFAVKPNGQLERYLTRYSQDVLHHYTFLHTNIERHPDNFFVSSLAYSLRMLSYQGPNSARQYLQRYTKNLLQKFRGSSKFGQRLSHQKYKDLKDELDSLLANWCPIGFVPRGVEQPRNLAVIQQEQVIFSAYANTCLYPYDTTASSLICGEYFIHAYHITWHNPPRLFMLFTYATHNNAISCSTFGRHDIDWDVKTILVKARTHLNNAGKEFGYPEPPES